MKVHVSGQSGYQTRDFWLLNQTLYLLLPMGIIQEYLGISIQCKPDHIAPKELNDHGLP